VARSRSKARSVPTFYRVVYSDDPFLESEGLDRLRKAYGAELIILPVDEDPGKTRLIRVTSPRGESRVHWNPSQENMPLDVDGIVWHVDANVDRRWVVGVDPTHPQPSGSIDPVRNPLLADAQLAESVTRNYPVVSVHTGSKSARVVASPTR